MSSIRILEKLCEGKSLTAYCEDILFVSEEFVAVIDGVTAKSDFSYEGKTTGRLASEIICRTLETLPKEYNLEQTIEEINKNLNQFYEEHTFPYNKREMGLQAVCAIYSNYNREIWLIGDCQAKVDGKLYQNQKKSDIILANMRALVIESLQYGGMDKKVTDYAEQARNLILPWIIKATAFANKSDSEYGYSVINGDRIPESLVNKIVLDEKSHEIILASDGYPVVEKNLALTEERLQKILEMDPECCKIYLSTKGVKDGCKSFDDRTYIRFCI